MSLHVYNSTFPRYGPRSLDGIEGRLVVAPHATVLREQTNTTSGTATVVRVRPMNLFGIISTQPVYGTVNSDVSLLQTASGALSKVKTYLQTIRQIAVEAADERTTFSQRETLHVSISRLVNEIDSIGKQTNYLGIRVFDQSTANIPGDPKMLAILKGLQGGWLENAEKLIKAYYGLKADGAPLSVELTSFTDGPYGVSAQVVGQGPAYGPGMLSDIQLQIDRADFIPTDTPDGGSHPIYSDRIIAHEMAHAIMGRSMNYVSLVRNAGWFIEGMAEFIEGGDERLAFDLEQLAGDVQKLVSTIGNGLPSTSAGYSAAYAATRFLHDQIKSAGGDGIREVTGYLYNNQRASLDDAFRNAVAPLGGPVSGYTSNRSFLNDFKIAGAAYILSRVNLTNADTGAIGGLDADDGPIWTAQSVIPDTGTRTGNDVLTGFVERFDVAANTQSRNITAYQASAYSATGRKAAAGAMNASALGINALNLIADPTDAINQADRAIKYVDAERARISVQMNRFDSMFTNVKNIFTNFGASQSWFLDLLSLTEYVSLVGQKIRTNPQAAFQAQANVSRELVLHLLQSK